MRLPAASLPFVEAMRQRLFRFGQEQRLPVVLTQRRIFIVPSGAGVMFALVLAIMLIGAINYELGLGHALVFLLASIGVVTILHTFRNLVALEISPGRSEAVFAGDSAHFVIHVDNPTARPRQALELAFGKAAAVVFDLAATERRSVSVSLPTHRRGLLDPGRLTLTTRYPLGLLRAWSYPHPPLSCLVYPRPQMSPLPGLSNANAAPRGAGGEIGDDDFAGLRQRQPGDSLRHVAWKVAARDGGEASLLVKQFAGNGAGERWLEWAQTTATHDSEARLSQLAGWVLVADREGSAYGLRLPGREISPAIGEMHRAACLEALALYGES
ncbi:DUF58 domain-containing protein [Rhodocyclus tenuis]|uniref:DUF58 domain-containing protein n=1 Tax=Rhodocyclus tenuis TaxID=1066 RepID=UPI001F5B2E7B|nr:DUF58 domain-containing protein [Rhodocyclus tenuis]MBK1679497.1 DUF58 domain-containing protein [Rhodocyclus tenuis]